jgi:hypothetical protein
MASAVYQVRKQLPVATVGYTPGYVVGGAQQLSGFFTGAQNGFITSVGVVERGNQMAPFSFLFFAGKPAATFTDNAVFPNLSVADCGLLLPERVDIAATDYASFGNASIAAKEVLAGVLALSQDLWVVLVTSGSPLYPQVTALNLTVTAYQDG